MSTFTENKSLHIAIGVLVFVVVASILRCIYQTCKRERFREERLPITEEGPPKQGQRAPLEMVTSSAYTPLREGQQASESGVNYGSLATATTCSPTGEGDELRIAHK